MCFMLLLFFFFKQKTAYELRISDWSSDVCSSDLLGRRPDLWQQQRLGHRHARRACHSLRDAAAPSHRPRRRCSAGRHGRGDEPTAPATAPHTDLGPGQDRKSVVWGKSVSVRVGLGGRRIITKKQKKQNNHE